MERQAWPWLFVAAFIFVPIVVTLYPYFRIIRRAGHSGWWILLGVVPGMNVIMLWVFAFAPWPAIDRDRRF